MNTGVNVLGQGNRANITIGRALQLVVRNVGGGRPGEVDRATHGNPGKLGFCFAEDEEGSPWDPLAESPGRAGRPRHRHAVRRRGPALRRRPEVPRPRSLAPSIAACLRTVHHPKLPLGFDAILVVGPEHARVFAEAGWSRERLGRSYAPGCSSRAPRSCTAPAASPKACPVAFADATLPKFRPGGLLIVHAGGGAGLFSAIIAGWANGAVGSQPVTRRCSVSGRHQGGKR